MNFGLHWRIRRVIRNSSVAWQTAIGTARGNAVSAYWWIGVKNFGDLLTPVLLKSYGHTPVLVPPGKCSVVSTGSILGMIQGDYSGVILGSGLLSPEHAKSFPNANIVAVRGELTRDLIGAPQSTILGDPGILSCQLLKQRERKTAVVGIVPHYADRSDRRITDIAHRYPGQVRIINVQRSPSKVIREIDRCAHILSSSLHGLIAADSLGIPNGWIELSGRVAGNGFKFRDYYSAYQETCAPAHISGEETPEELVAYTRKPSVHIREAQGEMHQTFLTLISACMKR